MTKNNFPITDAGQKYLELYAEPVVANTYLKLALLVLSVVALALLALFYRTETAALRLKPLIISVSDTGRGQVMQYDDFAKIPIDRVSKYYLAHWREVPGAIHQQQREMRIAFKEKMNQPPSGIGLLCVHQYTAAKGGVPARSKVHRVLDGKDCSNVVIVQAQSECHRRQQLRIGAIEQDGFFRSHGQLPNAWSSRQ